MSQGKNAKLAVEFKANLSDILAELAFTMEKKQISPKSAMAADLVTVGDSWLATAVQGGLIDPIPNAEQFEWFKRLHPKWQVRRFAKWCLITYSVSIRVMLKVAQKLMF